MTHSIATYHQKRNEKKPTHHHLPRRRRTAAPPGTASAEEKPLPEYLSILPRSDCREAGALGGSEVKPITIRLPDVEAAMFQELQSRQKEFGKLQALWAELIRSEYQKLVARGSGNKSL